MTDQQEGINRQAAVDVATIRAEVESLRALKDDVAELKRDVREGNHAIRDQLQGIVLNIAKIQATNDEQQKQFEERGRTLQTIQEMIVGGSEAPGFFERLRKLEEKEIKRAKFLWAMGVTLSTLLVKTAYEFLAGVHK